MQQKILERDVLKACLDYLHIQGIFCWRTNNIPAPTSDGHFRRFVGLRGVSDLLGVCKDGRFLAVECKSSTGKLSSYQEEFQRRVAELGGVACVVRSVDELEADLKEANVI